MGMINLQTLENEINTDPKGYGWPALKAAGNAQGLADAMNLARSGEQIPQATLKSSDIFQAIAPSEWTGANMVLLKFQYLQLLIEVGSGSNRIDLSNGNVKAALDLIFPAGSTPNTNAAMHALYTRNGSRIETLFGAGTVVSIDDIGNAWHLG